MKTLIILLFSLGIACAGEPLTPEKFLANKVRTETIKNEDGGRTEYTLLKLPDEFIMGMVERVIYNSDGSVRGRITTIFKKEGESYSIAFKGMHTPYYTEYHKPLKNGGSTVEYRDSKGQIMLSIITDEDKKYLDKDGKEVDGDDYLRLLEKLDKIE